VLSIIRCVEVLLWRDVTMTLIDTGCRRTQNISPSSLFFSNSALPLWGPRGIFLLFLRVLIQIMKAKGSSETSSVNNLVTRPNKPEGLNPSNQSCVSLKRSNQESDQITTHNALSTFGSVFKFMLANYDVQE